jgi:hypothetical protein
MLVEAVEPVPTSLVQVVQEAAGTPPIHKLAKPVIQIQVVVAEEAGTEEAPGDVGMAATAAPAS